MKKLIYISNVRIPTEKAHGIQIMKTCEAFADIGIDVKLVAPHRFNYIKTGPFDYYCVRKNFKITKLPTIDFVKLGRVGFWIQSLSFAIAASLSALFKKTDIIYSREELPLFFLSFFKKNLFWETHTGRYNFIVKRLLRKCAGIVSITNGLKDFYINKGINNSKILVAPDAVDLEKFAVEASKDQCRQKLGLPRDKKIIMYTGHLYDWKGADTLAEAAKWLGENELVVFVGGVEKEIKEFKTKYGKIKNILVVGHKPHGDMPFYLKVADVLVLPNRSDNKVSAKYTSPMKLFEYMSAVRPVVASDLPSIREVLSESNALLVESDNAEKLASGIKSVLQDEQFAGRISEQAFLDVKNHTWQKRAEDIIKFLDSKHK